MYGQKSAEVANAGGNCLCYHCMVQWEVIIINNGADIKCFCHRSISDTAENRGVC